MAGLGLLLTYGRKGMHALRQVFPSSHYALLSLFFFAGLELSFALRRWVFLIISILLGIIIVGVILIRAEEKGRFHPSQVILPALAALGITAFSLFLPTTLWIHFYFGVAAILFFLLLKHGAKQAYPTWNWIITLVILFVSMAALLGWRFHLYTPPFIILGITFVMISLLNLQSLLRYNDSIAESWLVSLAVAFVLSEIVWVLQFLPLHFTVQAGIITALYYTTFQLTSGSYERRITYDDVVEYISVGAIAIAILLATAHWR